MPRYLITAHPAESWRHAAMLAAAGALALAGAGAANGAVTPKPKHRIAPSDSASHFFPQPKHRKVVSF